MSRAKLFRKRSHFYKIFSFFLLVLLLITIFNYSTMIYLKSNLINSQMDEQKTYIDNYSLYVNEVLTSISNIFSYVENDNMVYGLSTYDYRSNYRYVDDIVNLTKKLILFKTSVGEILDFYVYIYNNEYMYTPSGQTLPKTYFENRYQGSYEEWLELLGKNQSLSISKWNFKPKENSEYKVSDINIVKSINYNDKKVGTMVVNLKSSFVDNLFKNREFSNNRMIYMVNSRNEVIGSNTSVSLDDFLKNSGVSITENSSQYIKGKGIITHKASPIHNVKYVIFTPRDIVVKPLDNIFYMINIVFFVLLTLLIVFTFFMSKKLYRPFKNIVDILSNEANNEDTKADPGNETEYIKGRIMQIVSANHQLKTTISDTTPFVLDAVLYKMLVGSFDNEHTALIPEDYNIKFSEGSYSAFVIAVDLFSEEEEKIFAEYLGIFKDIIYEYAGKWIVSIITTKTNEYTVITYNSNDEGYKEVLNAFGKILKELNTKLSDSKFYIGIGSQVENILKIRHSYKQSSMAIFYRKVNESINIIKYSEDFEEDKPFIPRDFELELTGIFKQNNREYAAKYIKDILMLNYKNNITIKSYIELCFMINSFINRYVTSFDSLKYKELIYIDMNSYLYSVEQLNDILLSNLSIIFEISTAKLDKVPMIDKIVLYIDENFNKDINLMSVADHLGYNPNYLSRYFKQAKGVNFTDYLNRKKIEYAKNELMTTRKTIKNIGESAGFSSSSIFIRTFEQYEGLTPGEFRKIIAK